jgi:hypothetical protein
MQASIPHGVFLLDSGIKIKTEGDFADSFPGFTREPRGGVPELRSGKAYGSE